MVIQNKSCVIHTDCKFLDTFTACPVGTYKDDNIDDGICVPCPEHSTTAIAGSKDRVECMCLERYTGPPGGPCIGKYDHIVKVSSGSLAA